MDKLNQPFMFLSRHITESFYNQVNRQANIGRPLNMQYTNQSYKYNRQDLLKVKYLTIPLSIKQNDLDFLLPYKNLNHLSLEFDYLFLDINNTTHTTDQIEKALEINFNTDALKTLPKLKNLELVNIFNMREIDVSQNPELEMLFIRNAPKLKTIKGIENLHNLKALEISDTRFFTPDFDVFDIIDNNPNLEFLTLDYDTIPYCVDKHPDFFERLEAIENTRPIIFAWNDGEAGIFKSVIDFKVYLENAKNDYENAQRVLSTIIKPDMSYDLKLYSIYQYVVQKIYYDDQSTNMEKEKLKLGQKLGNESYEARTTHTALTKKRVLCSGYAKATNYLCRLAGLDTRTCMVNIREPQDDDIDKDYNYMPNHIAVYDCKLEKYCDPTIDSNLFHLMKKDYQLNFFLMNFDEYTKHTQLNILEKGNNDKHSYPLEKRELLDSALQKYAGNINLDIILKNTPNLKEFLENKTKSTGEHLTTTSEKITDSTDWSENKLSNLKLSHQIYEQAQCEPIIKNSVDVSTCSKLSNNIGICQANKFNSVDTKNTIPTNDNELEKGVIPTPRGL